MKQSTLIESAGLPLAQQSVTKMPAFSLTRMTYLALLVLLMAGPAIGLYPVFVMKLLCFALFACAFNLLLGFTGLLSFGHAAFFGAAAYTTGWVVKSQNWTPELALLAGTTAAAYPSTMPHVTGDCAARSRNARSMTKPAFASAKSGTIT